MEKDLQDIKALVGSPSQRKLKQSQSPSPPPGMDLRKQSIISSIRERWINKFGGGEDSRITGVIDQAISNNLSQGGTLSGRKLSTKELNDIEMAIRSNVYVQSKIKSRLKAYQIQTPRKSPTLQDNHPNQETKPTLENKRNKSIAGIAALSNGALNRSSGGVYKSLHFDGIPAHQRGPLDGPQILSQKQGDGIKNKTSPSFQSPERSNRKSHQQNLLIDSDQCGKIFDKLKNQLYEKNVTGQATSKKKTNMFSQAAKMLSRDFSEDKSSLLPSVRYERPQILDHVEFEAKQRKSKSLLRASGIQTSRNPHSQSGTRQLSVQKYTYTPRLGNPIQGQDIDQWALITMYENLKAEQQEDKKKQAIIAKKNLFRQQIQDQILENQKYRDAQLEEVRREQDQVLKQVEAEKAKIELEKSFEKNQKKRNWVMLMDNYNNHKNFNQNQRELEKNSIGITSTQMDEREKEEHQKSKQRKFANKQLMREWAQDLNQRKLIKDIHENQEKQFAAEAQNGMMERHYDKNMENENKRKSEFFSKVDARTENYKKQFPQTKSLTQLEFEAEIKAKAELEERQNKQSELKQQDYDKKRKYELEVRKMQKEELQRSIEKKQPGQRTGSPNVQIKISPRDSVNQSPAPFDPTNRKSPSSLVWNYASVEDRLNTEEIKKYKIEKQQVVKKELDEICRERQVKKKLENRQMSRAELEFNKGILEQLGVIKE